MINYESFILFLKSLDLNDSKDTLDFLNRLKELAFNIKTMGFHYAITHFHQKITKLLIKNKEEAVCNIKNLSFLGDTDITCYVNILSNNKDISNIFVKKLLIDKLVILTKYVEIYKMENNL